MANEKKRRIKLPAVRRQTSLSRGKDSADILMDEILQDIVERQTKSLHEYIDYFKKKSYRRK